MTRSFVGSNVALDHITNYGPMIDLHRAVNPTVMLGMVDAAKDANKIRELQRDLPGAQVIARVWHEHEGGYAQPPTGKGDTRPMIATPESVLGEQVELGRNGLWLHVMNEPSAFMKPFEVQRTVDWLVKFIDLAAPENCACVLANLADMHPPIIGGWWDPIWWPLLRKLAAFPKLMRLGLHHYGPDKITDVLTALNATCKELRITPPQVVSTEFGLDSTGQDDRANGYHSRGYSGAQFVQWQRDQVQGDLKPFIASGQVIGLTTFQWSVLWGPFSMAFDTGYHDAYKASAQRGAFDVTVSTKPFYKPGVMPEGASGDYYYKIGFPSGAQKRNLRALPDEKTSDIGDVPAGVIVRLYDFPVAYDSLNRKWQWCVRMEGVVKKESGWMWSDGIQLTPVPEPVEPPPEDTPPQEPPPMVPKETRFIMTRTQRETMINSLLDVVAVLLNMQETLID